MFIHLVDENNGHLGNHNLAATRWRMAETGFVNDEDISIKLETGGRPAKMRFYIQGRRDPVSGGPVKCDSASALDTILFRRGEMNVYLTGMTEDERN